jgi:hypothetical protein
MRLACLQLWASRLNYRAVGYVAAGRLAVEILRVADCRNVQGRVRRQAARRARASR